ncbi:hypothetical protein B0H63DRAFT_19188 [Podospora didyma]|uniref:Uncharacterized protein n=1 Tax=Podospora didyma TaxID=330526 RepID=A0AAE0U7Q1_9PEZI|nr:hypothetical protein B0H63DRAFT_19188 [Podospora didyma]
MLSVLYALALLGLTRSEKKFLQTRFIRHSARQAIVHPPSQLHLPLTAVFPFTNISPTLATVSLPPNCLLVDSRFVTITPPLTSTSLAKASACSCSRPLTLHAQSKPILFDGRHVQ